MDEIIRQILSKESLSDADINILVKNKGLLSQDVLVRLGLAAVVVVKPEVLPVIEPVIEAPIVSAPKKRGRKPKII